MAQLTRQQMSGLLGQSNSHNVKSRTNRRQWNKIKRVAAKRGLTIEGLLSGQPTSMAERSRAGILKQARQTTTAAFAPGFTELDQQGQRLAAIDDKRRADADHYKQWLATKQEELFSKARADDATLMQKQGEIQATVDGAWDQAQAQARARAEQQVGNVSDPNASTALDMTDEKALATQQIANARQETADQVGNSQRAMQNSAAANQAFLAGLDSDRANKVFGAQKDLQDQRGKLGSDRSAETAKEVSRLLDQEIEKTSANREFNAALQQLGIKRDELDANIRDDRADNKAAARKQAETERANKARERLQDINAQIAQGRLTESQRHNLVNERNDLRRIIQQGKDGAGKGKTKKDITAWRNYRSALGQAKSLKGSKAGEAVELLTLKFPSYDPDVIRAAVNASRGGNVDAKLAKQIRKMYGFDIDTVPGANSYYGKGGGYPDKR